MVALVRTSLMVEVAGRVGWGHGPVPYPQTERSSCSRALIFGFAARSPLSTSSRARITSSSVAAGSESSQP